MPPGLCRRGENDAVYHDEVRKRRRYKFGGKLRKEEIHSVAKKEKKI